MNTAQLIVLWYGSLVMVGILVFRTPELSALHLIAITALVMGVVIYTLKPHPSARKQWVLVSVFGPILAGILGLAGFFVYEARTGVDGARTAAQPASPTAQAVPGAILPKWEEVLPVLPPGMLKFVNVDLRLLKAEWGIAHLVGRVRNQSAYSLQGVKIKVHVFEGPNEVGGTTETFPVAASPCEIKDFEKVVSIGPGMQRKWNSPRVEYQVLDAWGKAEALDPARHTMACAGERRERTPR